MNHDIRDVVKTLGLTGREMTVLGCIAKSSSANGFDLKEYSGELEAQARKIAKEIIRVTTSPYPLHELAMIESHDVRLVTDFFWDTSGQKEKYLLQIPLGEGMDDIKQERLLLEQEWAALRDKFLNGIQARCPHLLPNGESAFERVKAAELAAPYGHMAGKNSLHVLRVCRACRKVK